MYFTKKNCELMFGGDSATAMQREVFGAEHSTAAATFKQCSLTPFDIEQLVSRSIVTVSISTTWQKPSYDKFLAPTFP